MEELRQKARAAKTCRHQRPVPVGWLSEPVQSRPVAVRKTLRSAPAAHRGGPTLQKPQHSGNFGSKGFKQASAKSAGKRDRWYLRGIPPSSVGHAKLLALGLPLETSARQRAEMPAGHPPRGPGRLTPLAHPQPVEELQGPAAVGAGTNPYGGECGRGSGDTAEASSCREGRMSPPPEKNRKRKNMQKIKTGAPAAAQDRGTAATSRSGLAPRAKLRESGSRPGRPRVY